MSETVRRIHSLYQGSSLGIESSKFSAFLCSQAIVLFQFLLLCFEGGEFCSLLDVRATPVSSQKCTSAVNPSSSSSSSAARAFSSASKAANSALSSAVKPSSSSVSPSACSWAAYSALIRSASDRVRRIYLSTSNNTFRRDLATSDLGLQLFKAS